MPYVVGSVINCAQDFEELARQIRRVEQDIEHVEDALRQIDKQLKEHIDVAQRQHLYTEKQQLRTKEEQLRTEKEQLRTKEEQLRTLQLRDQGGTPIGESSVAGQKRPRPSSMSRVSRIEEIQHGVHPVDSPSRGDRSRQLLRQELAVFSLHPLISLHALHPPSSSMRQALPINTYGLDPTNLLREDAFYPLATEFLPAWITSQTRGSLSKRNAESLYGPAGGVTMALPVTLPWMCEPELFTEAAPLHPAFNGEVKSAGAEMYNEVLTYVMFGMLKSLFSCTAQRFYARPPVGYGIVAFPHLGYLVAVEWIGKLFMTPVSQPFFLGSSEHASAVGDLPDVHFDAFIEVPTVGGAWASFPADTPQVQVIWTKEPMQQSISSEARDRFRKIIYCTAFDHLGVDKGATRLRALYETYDAISREVDDTRPPSLVPARLWFGAFAVLVDMEWIEGQHPAEGRLDEDTSIVEAVARAIAWLAHRKLLYCDIRNQNVLICETGSVHLIDYDDIVVVDRAPNCLADFKSLLAATAHERGEKDYSCILERVPNTCRKLDTLLQEAALG